MMSLHLLLRDQSVTASNFAYIEGFQKDFFARFSKTYEYIFTFSISAYLSIKFATFLTL